MVRQLDVLRTYTERDEAVVGMNKPLSHLFTCARKLYPVFAVKDNIRVTGIVSQLAVLNGLSAVLASLFLATLSNSARISA